MKALIDLDGIKPTIWKNKIHIELSNISYDQLLLHRKFIYVKKLNGLACIIGDYNSKYGSWGEKCLKIIED